jgi:hypothetical protein
LKRAICLSGHLEGEETFVDNEIFVFGRELLTAIYGKLSEVESGSSVRCARANKGKITLYRRSLASGNKGEVAFDVESHAARAGIAPGEVQRFLKTLKSEIGRDTERHQIDWPRVGFATKEEALLIARRLRQLFGMSAD